MRVRMPEGHHRLQHLHLDPQLLPELPLQAFLQAFPRLHLAARELPQPAQHALQRPLGDQHAIAILDHPRGDVVVGKGSARGPHGKRFRISLAEGGAESLERARRTARRLRGAEGGAQVHQGLIEIPRLAAREKAFRQGLQPTPARRPPRILLHREEPRQHPHPVPIDGGEILPEGDAEDRGRDVGAHPGQAAPFRKRLGERSAVFLHQRAGRAVQMPRPRIIS
ncbi:hypothetical protein HRbin22_02544 [Candidatus Thermoflexus japonica]|uniref:Uncharacterized protein n=1 Tax=Candidatus Thermoflexus japonica TaxID=2035417 RepID=A0A2H5YA55_9CHLR|nr:hypothetical protein HRbin22_02544 [Candidatus Thermoflexus japonica]